MQGIFETSQTHPRLRLRSLRQCRVLRCVRKQRTSVATGRVCTDLKCRRQPVRPSSPQSLSLTCTRSSASAIRQSRPAKRRFNSNMGKSCTSPVCTCPTNVTRLNVKLEALTGDPVYNTVDMHRPLRTIRCKLACIAEAYHLSQCRFPRFDRNLTRSICDCYNPTVTSSVSWLFSPPFSPSPSIYHAAYLSC